MCPLGPGSMKGLVLLLSFETLPSPQLPLLGYCRDVGSSVSGKHFEGQCACSVCRALAGYCGCPPGVFMRGTDLC